MKRWIPLAVLAAALFAVNVAGRVVAEVIINTDDVDTQNLIGVFGAVAMGLVALVGGIRWSVRTPMQQFVSELGLGLLIGTFASVLIGPLLVGGNPFGSGFGLVVAELLLFFGIGVAAAFIGFLAATVFGADYRSKHLKRVERHYGRRR